MASEVALLFSSVGAEVVVGGGGGRVSNNAPSEEVSKKRETIVSKFTMEFTTPVLNENVKAKVFVCNVKN